VSSGAPDGILADPDDIGRNAFGGWIELWTPPNDASDEAAVRGELIAVHADSVFVLGSELVAVARNDIAEAEMFAWDSHADRLGLWTTAGILGTITHGWFLVLTAPVWLISGSTAAGIQSRQPRFRLSSGDSWDDFRAYARFPAGLPASVTRAAFGIRSAPDPSG
jgi:hypothetical protein